MKTERLTTIDEHGSRRFVIPAEVVGIFRTWRNRVYFVLVILFLALPWIKINGLQAVLLDIPNRRFEIFGKLFLAHDTPLVFLIAAMAAMSLAFVTAVWGRVWCGWACPQTVFIDGLYRRIEIWIEGDYKTRRRLQRESLSVEKLWKATAKWISYVILSSLISHSVIAYFTGSTQLIEMIQGPPGENWTYFLLVSSMTALLLFNFGWFREQFCTIMCPYGRFQSVLMDDQSLTVLYDERRGEPRKGAQHDDSKRGDCVSCNRCVEVCPANIDIRNGVQMECIACTACIDACNEIMKRVNKPQNLIRYASVQESKFQLWRPRTVVYFTIVMICAFILTLSFLTHDPYAVTLLRAKDTPYQLMPNGMVLNHMKAHLFNQSQSNQEFKIELSETAKQQGVTLTQAPETNNLAAGKNLETHLFIAFPQEHLNSSGELHLQLVISEATTSSSKVKELIVVGPRPQSRQEVP